MNKKIFSVIAILILSVLTVLFAVGCENGSTADPSEKTPLSITVIEKHEGDYVIGEKIDLSEIKFTVNYSDKTKDTFTLTDLMISPEDRNAFFTPGVHAIAINYAGVTGYLQISVVQKEEVVRYNASFYSLGGTPVDPINDVDVITAFPMPEREGYIFDGWFVDVDFSDVSSDTTFSGKRVREPYTLTQNTAFYAKWLDKRTCSVTFLCDADIILPLQDDWRIRSEEERLHVGDIFQSYVYDASGRTVAQMVSRQGVGLLELPISSDLWENRSETDYMRSGDTIVRFQQDRNKNYVGMLVRRKDTVVNSTSIHYGEKIDITGYLLPAVDAEGHAMIIEGKKFVNWYVASGNAGKVTDDLIVKASFQTEKCSVAIYYQNGDKEIKVDHTYDYGFLFAYSSYAMPVKEGYTSRWVVYYNHSKQYVCPVCGYTETTDHKDSLACRSCAVGVLQEVGFEEMPDSTGAITLVQEYTLIQAYHVINTYNVTIQNGSLDAYPSTGLDEQAKESLKNGNIVMEPVYAEKESKTPFVVEWNSTFDYTQYTQDPKLNTPAAISDGYTAQWCYVVRDLDDNQTWYNTKGQIWSDEFGAFIEPERPEGEGANYWILYDAQGEYVAKIVGGIATEIKNPINLYAKYLKKDRTVNLRRQNESGGRGVMVRFTVPFYNDFNMYDALSYVDPDGYAFSPDRTSENDPIFDTVIRKKLAVYEEVRLYDLYLAKQRFDFLTDLIRSDVRVDDDRKADFVKFFIWMSQNAEEMRLLCDVCNGNVPGTFAKEALQTAVLNHFGVKVYSAPEFVAAFETFTDRLRVNGEGLYSDAAFLIGFFNGYYETLTTTYGLGYKNDLFTHDIDFDGFDLASFRRSWLYYRNTASYKFYCRQMDRSQDALIDHAHAVNYRYDYMETYLSDPIANAQYAVYEKYRDLYLACKNSSGYLYYCAGMDVAENETQRQLRICLSSNEDIEKFYLYSDTNYELQDKSAFYFVEDGVEDEWALEWYKTAEMNIAGQLDFVNEKITIIDDINIYCKDVDNRRYELVFYYGFDFTNNEYTSVERNVYPGNADVTIAGDYSSSVVRQKNGMPLTYDFIGWYDNSYQNYLITGYRGNGLRVTSSRVENVTYYAHYACTTTFTVKIYDKTQSTAYDGIRNYTDGYAVENDSIEYVLPAGSLFSVLDIYKGTKSEGGNTISGQEYYRQKRYVDYFNEYYDADNPLSLYRSFGYTAETCREIAETYQERITRYQSVLSAVKKQDYSLFAPEEYDYYLTGYDRVASARGDEFIANKNAFVAAYVALLEELYEKDFLDVSSFTNEFTDYIIHSTEYVDATGQATLFKDEWNKYHRNFYVREGDAYRPVQDGENFSNEQNYYAYFVTTDHDYDVILCAILENYAVFLEKFDEYQTNRNNYALQPKHAYFESMNDINAASDYDYEGAGEMKYDFRRWYLDASYTTPFDETVEAKYYLATDAARLDSKTTADWNSIKDMYYVFEPTVGFLKKATEGYDENVDYYSYDAGSFHAGDLAAYVYDKWNYYKGGLFVSRDGEYVTVEDDFDADEFYFTYDKVNESYDQLDDAALAELHGGAWSSYYTEFFTYDRSSRKYIPATTTFDKNAVYYSRYKKITTLVSSRLGGWDVNKEKYYVLKNGVYEKAGDSYVEGTDYYTSSSLYMSFVVTKDIILYANWMDISRGTEGLAYELVTNDVTGEKGYVVIDFVNNSQGAEKGYNAGKQYYYVTTNDNNSIPEIIEDTVELQIPASISSYKEATDLAAESSEKWSTEYVNFLIYNTSTFSYEVADRTYRNDVVYYDRNTQVFYPVIGIRKNALERYRTRITRVDLPLNLYFIEEGAFNLCPITSITRAEPRVSETALSYIIVDTNDNGMGVAIYQDDPFTGRIVGSEETPYEYSPAAGKTVLAYAVGSADTHYALRAGTVRIGDYVFRNSSLTEVAFGDAPVIKSIGKYAFSKTALSSFVVYSGIEDIGEYAFEQVVSLSRVIAQDNSSLKHIGKDAFEGTLWFRKQPGIVRLGWTNTVGSPVSTGAIVGFNVATGGGAANYDRANGGAYATYNDKGEFRENGDGNYYAVSNGADRVLYLCTKNINGVVIDVTLYGIVVDTDVRLIGDNAFDVAQGFKKIVISSPELKYIGKGAFQNSPQLERVVLGERNSSVSIDEIGKNAFSGCSRLTTIEYFGTLDSWCNITFDDPTANPFDYARILQLNGGSTQITEIVIPDTVTEIKPYTFYNMTALDRIVIGKNVVSIGEYAFYNCTATIEWASDIAISSIGASAFRGYQGVTLTLPATVTEIDEYAFCDCTRLSTLSLPSNLVKFGSHCIDNCSSLTYNVYGGASYLGGSGNLNTVLVKVDNKSIDTFTVRPGTKFIYDGVFAGCRDLSEVNVSTGLLGVGENAFYGCSSLEAIVFSGSKDVWYAVSRGENWNEETGAYVVRCSNGNVDSIEEKLRFVLKGNDTYEIVGCPAEVTELYLPAEHYGKAVTSVGARAFSGCDRLTSVTLPNTIVSIDSNAFNGCSTLTRVNYTGTLAEWCGITFGNATANPLYYARKLYIGSSVAPIDAVDLTGQAVTKINSYAFYNCTDIRTVTLPDTVTSVGVFVFTGCPIETATIPAVASMSVQNASLRQVSIIGGTSIASSSFSGCENLTEITIPATVTTIRNNAFSDCTALSVVRYGGSLADWTQITFGNEYANPIYYHNDLYYDGGSVLLGDTLDLSASSVRNINAYCFVHNKKLKTVVLPDTVQKIAKYAFAECDRLNVVDLGDGLTGIGNFSFAGCYSLTDVTLPSTLNSIGNGAFSECFMLAEVWNKSEQITVVAGASDNGNVGSYAMAVYTGSSYMTKLTESGGMVVYTDEGIKTLIGYIGDATVVTVPASVKYVRSYAFYQRGVTQVTLPDTVEEIGDHAFCGCKVLTSVNIPTSTVTIGDYAFALCEKLTSVELPNGLTSVGICAFNDCAALTSLIIPASVTTIGESAFDGCLPKDVSAPVLALPFLTTTRLEALTINGGEAVPDAAFMRCENLRTVALGSSVKSIGTLAFAFCYHLNKITFTGVRNGEIGVDAFVDCFRLTEVFAKSGWTPVAGSSDNGYLAYRALAVYTGSEASAITEQDYFIYYQKGTRKVLVDYVGDATVVTVPSGVTEVNSYAFYALTDLVSVGLPDTITKIGQNAFVGCSSIGSLTVPFVGNVLTVGTGVRYPLGYFFGEAAYEGGEATVQQYSLDDQNADTETKTYYLPQSLRSVTVLGGNIYGGAFRNCARLKEVRLLAGVASIEDGSFYGCVSLESMTLPVIGSRGFGSYFGQERYGNAVSVYQTIGTEEIEYYLPARLMHIEFVGTIIPDGAFGNCNRLTDISIASTVTEIGTNAFENCYRLVEVTNRSSLPITMGSEEYGKVGYYALAVYSGFHESLLSVNENDFILWNNDRVVGYVGIKTALVLPAGAKTVNKYAFASETSVRACTAPEGLLTIERSAFDGCVGMENFYPVSTLKTIGDRAFSGCASLRNFDLPASIEAIGNYAFSGCASFTAVSVPDTALSVGEYAFRNCQLLVTVVLPADLTLIPAGLFYNCEKLKNITIPALVETIGEYAFYGCKELNIMDIPSGVTAIGSYAFANCIDLRMITLPNTLTTLGENAFMNCPDDLFKTEDGVRYLGNASNRYLWLVKASVALTEYEINAETVHIASSAFAGCGSLATITIPDSVTSIGSGAFDDCSIETATITTTAITMAKTCLPMSTLKCIVIANGEIIDDNAFSGYSGLTKVIIGNSISSIGRYAFYNCSSLTSVTIGSGVRSVGEHAFDGCYKLVEVYNKSSLNITKQIEAYGYVGFYAKDVYTELYTSKLSTDSNGYILYTDGDVVSLIGYIGIDTELTLPQGITEIYQYAFYNCSSFTSVTIGSSVTSIGEYAFSGCTANIVWGDYPNIATIGSHTFANYSGTSVTIPDSVTSIENYAFSGCTANIVWGDYPNIATIGSHTFANYSGTSVTIPDSVTSIENYAFGNCSSLTSVTIGSCVRSIGYYAFHKCAGLTSIIVRNGNTVYHSVENCIIETESKTLILGCQNSVIPNDGSVTSIGEYAFYNCSGLTSITIPDSVTSIGEYAFSGCSGLTSITIPDSVTSIGEGAFYGCSGLTSITIPDTVTSIGEGAFAGCSGLASIIVDSVNTRYHSAGNCLIETQSKTLIVGCNNSIIPDDGSVTSIGEYAFAGCSGLTSITIPDTVTSIGEYAFCECSGLTSITIPAGVTSIGEGAFAGCSGLTTITIPDTVTSIGEYAFSGCSGLTTITIPVGVTSIGEYAFCECSGLTSITIPASVTSIGEDSFYECTGLTSIDFAGTMAQWDAITKGAAWNSNTGNYIVHCSDGDISKS